LKHEPKHPRMSALGSLSGVGVYDDVTTAIEEGG
jgi:hypothetical protein